MELRKVDIVDINGKKMWEGYFHCWATMWDVVGQCPMGIVERLGGSVEEVGLSHIRFVTPYGGKKDENKKD